MRFCSGVRSVLVLVSGVLFRKDREATGGGRKSKSLESLTDQTDRLSRGQNTDLYLWGISAARN
jgi:hypothetical protein